MLYQFFGSIEPPPGVDIYGGLNPGLTRFLSNIIRLVVAIAGLYTLFNLISAGYQFISSGDNPKGIQLAWGKIWQSLIGLIIVAAAFLLAALFGWIAFRDPGFILNPRIYGP